MRTRVWRDLGNKEVPVFYLDLTLENERELNIRLNKNTGEFDFEILIDEFEIKDLVDWGFDEKDFNLDNGYKIEDDENKTKLIDKFIIPPFSILDTRKGYWNDRKIAWKERINDNGESRTGTLSDKNSLMGNLNNGVSILDPVLAENIIKWFSFNKSNIFDCFAGDTVFGYVASHLENNFLGIELRQEQCKLNNERIKKYVNSKYICDDGQNVFGTHKERYTRFII